MHFYEAKDPPPHVSGKYRQINKMDTMGSNLFYPLNPFSCRRPSLKDEKRKRDAPRRKC